MNRTYTVAWQHAKAQGQRAANAFGGEGVWGARTRIKINFWLIRASLVPTSTEWWLVIHLTSEATEYETIGDGIYKSYKGLPQCRYVGPQL